MPKRGKANTRKRKGKLHKHFYSLTFNFKTLDHLKRHHQKFHALTIRMNIGLQFLDFL